MPGQPLNPFPGLRSFEPEEEHLFFGREKQVDELLRRLRQSRFLAVVGASGSGKSSLVRSGLIPALHSGYMTAAGSSWRIALMRPGADPIGNLAAVLDEPEVVGAGFLPGEMRRPLLEATLRRSGLGLAESVRYAHLSFMDNVLLVVDQFEELFRFKQTRTAVDARDEAIAFVKLLVEAVRQEVPRVFVVLTMRSEFIGRCTEFPGLAEAVNEGLYLVPRMTRDELRLAITGPIAVGGGAIAPRLVTRLLNDVGDDPDQLPILQHALMRTWDHWAGHSAGGGVIDLVHYEAIGTMRDALSRHADEAYADLGGPRDREVAERMFKALVEMTPNAGGVRRPCRVDDLCASIGTHRAEIAGVIDRFRMPGRSFLMPPSSTPLTDSTIVDLSHESLIRLWTPLIGWTYEETQSADVYKRLSEAAALHERGEAGLWRDPELQLAINWRDAHRPTSVWAVRYAPHFERAMEFLQHSQAARDQEEAERRRFRRQRLIAARSVAAVLFVLCVVAGFSLVFALRQRNDAFVQRAQAQGEAARARLASDQASRQRGLAENASAQAARERESAEREKARAEAAAVIAEAQRLEAQRQRSGAEQQRGEAEQQRAEAERQRQAAIEQQAKAENATRSAESAAAQAAASEKVASDARDEQVRLRDLSLARALASDAVGQADPPDVRVLMARQAYNLVSERGGNAHSPDITNALRIALENFDPGNVHVFVGHNDAVRTLTVSADGRLLTGSDDGRIRRFDARESTRPATLIANLGSPVRSIAFDAKGALFAAGSFDGKLRVWAYATGDRPLRLLKEWDGHDGAVSGIAFDPSGRLVSAGLDGQLRTWQPGTFAPEAPAFEKQPSGFVTVALSPQGDRVAAAAEGGGVLLWEFPAPSAKPVAIGGSARVSSLAFSPDGRRLAGGTASGELRTWTLADPLRTENVVAAHRARITALRFDGAMLASGSLDGDLKVWTANESMVREQPLVLTHGAWVWAVTTTGDDGRVFSAGADGRVRAWATSAAALAEEACRRVGRNLTEAEWSVHVSPVVPYAPTCPNVVDRRGRAQPR